MNKIDSNLYTQGYLLASDFANLAPVSEPGSSNTYAHTEASVTACIYIYLVRSIIISNWNASKQRGYGWCM